MASSGNFTTSKYNSTIGLKLSWTSTKDVVNNRTLVKWTLTSVGGSTGQWWMAGPVTATINGSKVVNTTSRFKLYGGGKYKKTGSIYVTHNADGTKSVSMSVKAAIYSSSVNCTGSKTYALDKIDRYAYITGGVTTFSNEDYPTVTYANPLGSEIVTNLKLRILWNNDTEYTDWVSVGDTTESYTFTSETLTDANKQSMMSLSPTGDDIPLKFDLASTMDGVEYHSYYNGTMVMGALEPTISGLSYYNQISDITNIMGNNTDLLISSNVLFEYSLAKFTLHFDSIVASAGAKIKSIAYVYGDYFDRGMSNPIYNRWNYFIRTFSENEQQHELTNYEVTDLSYAYFNKIINGWIDTPETGVNYPALGIIIEDTRGKVLKTYLPVSLFMYTYPSAQISLNRRSNFYSETYVTASCTYSELKNSLNQPRNQLTIKCLYKKTSDQTYSNIIDLSNGVQSTIQLSNEYSWDVIIAIKDSVTSILHAHYPNKEDTPEWVQYHYVVSAGTPIFFIDKLKKAISVNCLPSHENDLEIDGAAVLRRYENNEKCVGFWTDGSRIYERTESESVSIPSDTWTDLETLPSGVKIRPISIIAWHSSNAGHICYNHLMAQFIISSGKLQVLNPRGSAIDISGYCIQYTYVTSS